MNQYVPLIFRILILAALILFSVRPSMIKPDKNQPQHWAVLLDTSKSMNVADPEPRINKAKNDLKSILDEFPNATAFQFSSKVEKIEVQNIDAIKSEGHITDIAQGLTEAFKETDPRGIILLSDGRPAGGGDVLSVAASLERPLITVSYGDRGLFKDIAVKNIQSPPFAFKFIPTSLSAFISVSGLKDKKITVKLKDQGKILGLQSIEIPSNEYETTVNFNWTPETIGSRVLRVETTVFEDEVSRVNNTREITLDVGREKFRVLYICGVPGPEYGFLRYQFKSDPAVELVTFVILRNASNVVTVPDHELSLIPFPTQDTLVNQMKSFDLIVFEEFAFWQYGLSPQILHAIRRRVEDGGAFLVMGGPVTFGPGSLYAMPEIQEMIPVKFASPDVAQVEGPFAFQVKAPNHPIMRIKDNTADNLREWKNLPNLENITLLPGVKEGATILGAINRNGKSFPVLTVWRFGKGRVAALSARTTWRWSLSQGKDGQGGFFYQQFWRNMVLWLTHSDQYKTVRLGLEEKRPKTNETNRVRVWVYDDYFKPLDNAQVRLSVKNPADEGEIITMQEEAPGVFAGDFVGKTPGSYLFQAWVTRQGKKYGSDRQSIKMTEGQLESEDLRPDMALMKELALLSNGRHILAPDFDPDQIKILDRDYQQRFGKKFLIWNSPWLFFLVVLILAIEWIYRRRRGMP